MSFSPALRRVAFGLLLTGVLGVILIQGSSYFKPDVSVVGQVLPAYQACATTVQGQADLLAATQDCCIDNSIPGKPTIRCKEGCPAGTSACPAGVNTAAEPGGCCQTGQTCGYNAQTASYFCSGEPTPPPPPPSSGSSSSCEGGGGSCSMTSGANGGCCGGLTCSNLGTADGSGPCDQPGGCPSGTSCSDYFFPPTCFPSNDGGPPQDGVCREIGGGGGGGSDPGGGGGGGGGGGSPVSPPGFPPSPIGTSSPPPIGSPAPSTTTNPGPKTPAPGSTPTPSGPSPSTSPSSPTTASPAPTTGSVGSSGGSSAGRSNGSSPTACQVAPPTCPPARPGCQSAYEVDSQGCLRCTQICPSGGSSSVSVSVSSSTSVGPSRPSSASSSSRSSSSTIGGGGGGSSSSVSNSSSSRSGSSSSQSSTDGGPSTSPPTGPTTNPGSQSSSSTRNQCTGFECAIFGCPQGFKCNQTGQYPQCMTCDLIDSSSSSSSSNSNSTSSQNRCTENACRDAGGCPLYFNCRVLLNGTPPNCHVCEPVGASSSGGSTGAGNSSSAGSNGSSGSQGSSGSNGSGGSSRSSTSGGSSSQGLPTGQTSCGDGIRQAGETCDLGSSCTGTPASCNRVPGTFGLTCLCDPRNTATCTPPPDMVWNQGCINPRCGDGVVNNFINYRGLQVNGQLIREECDDGNARDGDGCSAVCVRETPNQPRCGNGRLDANEQCDDGNTLDTDLCTNQCRLSSRIATGPTPTPASTQSLLRCGDGVVTAGEMCDKGSSCTSDVASCNRPVGTRGAVCACTPGDPSCPLLPGITWNKGCTKALCGDGIVNNWATFAGKTVNYEGLTETCDKGDLNGKPGSGCTQTCSLTHPDLCGNSKVDAGETCDRGAQNGKPGVACTLTCQTLELGLCGNQVLDSGEECDGTSGCTATCQREDPSTPNSLCGNGEIDPGEECDSTQGCSNTCFRTEGVCGDGIVQKLLGEQCEPSTHDPSLVYGCGQDCRHQSEFCGNSVLDIGEQCDEGALNDDALPDRCRTNCSFSRCGDSVLDSAEQCDDGNHRAGDGCDLYCRRETGAPSDSLAQTIDFPVLGDLTPIATSHPPAGQTGPAAIAVMAAGAAAGWAFVRRRRK